MKTLNQHDLHVVAVFKQLSRPNSDGTVSYKMGISFGTTLPCLSSTGQIQNVVVAASLQMLGEAVILHRGPEALA